MYYLCDAKIKTAPSHQARLNIYIRYAGYRSRGGSIVKLIKRIV